ncbi:DUF3667 domain-containing protein [Hyunsoonleella ulvae]|uniref:DUF3667 domain-containing protein n=1 Tax=Hyunsoonleella ulvae TaxID=2799948 RepID=UPI0019396DDC|nr:DUF3667 domain-containing protein [Hyunsoonleella ulvae]
MAKSLETCKNCNQKFSSAFNFCPYCGQQAKDDLTVKVLFYNTISNYFSFDARFFKSFFPLLLKPGFIAREFVRGKRLRYLHPAQMYLFIAVVFFFLFSFIQRSQVKGLDERLAKTLKQGNTVESVIDQSTIDSINQELKEQKHIKDSVVASAIKRTLQNNKFVPDISNVQIDSIVKAERMDADDIMSFDFNTKRVDSLIQLKVADSIVYKAMGMGNDPGYWEKRMYAQALKFYKSRKGGSILQAFYDAIPFAMFFLLPIFALILRVLHSKRGTYAHHLVFSFYYFSFLFTVFSVVLAVNFLIDIPNWVDFLIIMSTFIYLIIALKRFYVQGWFKSILKAGLGSFVFLSVVTPLTFFILSVFAFLFY